MTELAEPADRDGAAAQAARAGLGLRLRRERGGAGLSLRELARRLDVSPSLVSQIETGKIQPSVRTLYAIVRELGISFDELFDAGTPRPPAPLERPVARPSPGAAVVQRAGERQAIELERGVRWERLTGRNDPSVEFLYAVYEPGGESTSADALVRHNGREFGLVLAGRLDVTVGFDEHVLGPGDSILFESTTPHRLHNAGDVAVEAVWVVLGRHEVPVQ